MAARQPMPCPARCCSDPVTTPRSNKNPASAVLGESGPRNPDPNVGGKDFPPSGRFAHRSTGYNWSGAGLRAAFARELRCHSGLHNLATALREPQHWDMAKRKRILYVEDNPAVRTIRTLMMERDGYEVITAATVAEGLQALSTAHADLAVVDYGLPDGRGDHLC